MLLLWMLLLLLLLLAQGPDSLWADYSASMEQFYAYWHHEVGPCSSQTHMLLASCLTTFHHEARLAAHRCCRHVVVGRWGRVSHISHIS